MTNPPPSWLNLSGVQPTERKEVNQSAPSIFSSDSNNPFSPFTSNRSSLERVDARNYFDNFPTKSLFASEQAEPGRAEQRKLEQPRSPAQRLSSIPDHGLSNITERTDEEEKMEYDSPTKELKRFGKNYLTPSASEKTPQVSSSATAQSGIFGALLKQAESQNVDKKPFEVSLQTGNSGGMRFPSSHFMNILTTPAPPRQSSQSREAPQARPLFPSFSEPLAVTASKQQRKVQMPVENPDIEVLKKKLEEVSERTILKDVDQVEHEQNVQLEQLRALKEVLNRKKREAASRKAQLNVDINSLTAELARKKQQGPPARAMNKMVSDSPPHMKQNSLAIKGARLDNIKIGFAKLESLMERRAQLTTTVEEIQRKGDEELAQLLTHEAEETRRTVDSQNVDLNKIRAEYEQERLIKERREAEQRQEEERRKRMRSGLSHSFASSEVRARSGIRMQPTPEAKPEKSNDILRIAFLLIILVGGGFGILQWVKSIEQSI